MAISQVRAKINGGWVVLTYNSGTGKWQGTVTAPSVTSFNQSNGVYAVIVEAINTAGTTVTATTNDPTVGNSLKLKVLEKVAPTIAITSPGSGAFVTNSQQAIVFQLRDETNGSGVKLSTLSFKIDGGTAITSASNGMVCTAVSGGYDCVYSPPNAISDGAHTITINVSDNDGNVATQASRSYIIDTNPPVLNVTSPTSGLITNNPAITVLGSTNDATSSPVTVTVKLNSGTAQTVTVEANGSFSKSVTLVEGANTILVTATDSSGKQSTVSLSITLDTTAPIVSNVSISPNPVDAGQTLTISVVIS